MREQYMRNGEGFLLVFSVIDRSRFVTALHSFASLSSLFIDMTSCMYKTVQVFKSVLIPLT